MLSKLTSIIKVNAFIGFTIATLVFHLFFLVDHPFLGMLVAGFVSGTTIALILHRRLSTILIASAFALASLIGGYFILTSVVVLYLTEGKASFEDAVFGFYFLFLFGFALIGAVGATSVYPRLPATALMLGAKSFVIGGLVGTVIIGPFGLLGKLPLIFVAIGISIANAVGGGILALKLEELTEDDHHERELSLKVN